MLDSVLAYLGFALVLVGLLSLIVPIRFLYVQTRLFVIEGEFAKTLKVMERETNTLSPVIRQAWADYDNLKLSISSVPEPGSTILLLCPCLVLLVGLRMHPRYQTRP